MPEAEKTGPNVEVELLSELTRRRVTTSLGLLSIQNLMSERNACSDPASRREQDVWHNSRTPFSVWTCAWRSRTPAERAVVAL